MIFTGLPEVFVSNLKISLFASFLITFPFLIIQMVLFVSPAMYKKEKKILLPYIFFNTIIIFFGSNFRIFLINSFDLGFFYFFRKFFKSGINVELESRYSEYMKLIMFLLLASGISFEFPILLIICVKLKIVSISMLRKNRKYFFIAILLFSAIFTPPDIISQLGIAIPLIIFYEFSLVFINFF